MDTYVIDPKDEKAILAYELYSRADRGLFGSSSPVYSELKEGVKNLFRTLGSVFFEPKPVDTEDYLERTEKLLNGATDEEFNMLMSRLSFAARENLSDNIRARLTYILVSRWLNSFRNEANENSR